MLSRGGNYGWVFREGTVNGPKSGSAPAGFASLAPPYNYQRGTGKFQGNSITGGGFRGVLRLVRHCRGMRVLTKRRCRWR